MKLIVMTTIASWATLATWSVLYFYSDLVKQNFGVGLYVILMCYLAVMAYTIYTY